MDQYLLWMLYYCCCCCCYYYQSCPLHLPRVDVLQVSLVQSLVEAMHQHSHTCGREERGEEEKRRRGEEVKKKIGKKLEKKILNKNQNYSLNITVRFNAVRGHAKLNVLWRVVCC